MLCQLEIPWPFPIFTGDMVQPLYPTTDPLNNKIVCALCFLNTYLGYKAQFISQAW